MYKHAVINKDNIVVNIILWDTESKWQPPIGCYLIRSDIACINDLYNKEENTFTAPLIIDIPKEEV
jgi:hypothetical protein